MNPLDDLDILSPITDNDLRPENLQRILQYQIDADPEMWRRCYPRIYEPYKPNLYASPKELAHQVFSLVQKVEMGFLGDSEKFEMLWASQLYKYSYPLYWVAPDLYDAIRHTTPPLHTLDYYHMAMPFPAATFMIPLGKMTHALEGNVLFISYGKQLADEDFTSVARFNSPKTWSNMNGGMIFLAKTAKYLTHWNMPYDAFPYVDLAKLDDTVKKYADNIHTTGFFQHEGLNMTDADWRLGVEVMHMVFGLLLFMQRKPELVSGGQLLKKVKAHKGKAPREFWSPRVIGANYRIRRLEKRHLGGTHASPRGHWVDGYWKEQRYGPQNSLTKEILIDPYWRGGDEE